jgi:hypothetical protein
VKARRGRAGAAGLAGLLLAACTVAGPSGTPGASGTAEGGTPPPSAITSASAPASAIASPSAAPSSSPTAAPSPSLALDPPGATDPRPVVVTVTPELPTDGSGRVVVTVESRADTRIDELVLRWPTALADTVVLQPFAPSDDRIREGGPPLVQPWTKWVIGPGEEGEPDGTTSVGWGPLLPGATLTIPLVATRVAPGPTAFDLQVLSRNDLLADPDGNGAELRVELP